MPRILPGSDKYREPVTQRGDAPWDDPLVLKANAEVPVVEVLNRYFSLHVPRDAEGWKSPCPLRREHADGGIDKQFRVYASSNSGHCFESHGTLDPVRLWRLRSYFPTMLDAATDLMDTFGVEYRTKPYWERMAALRSKAEYSADPEVVTQIVQVYLTSRPDYEALQYSPEMLRSVNFVLSEVAGLCERATSIEEVDAWLHEVRARLTTTLTACRRDADSA